MSVESIEIPRTGGDERRAPRRSSVGRLSGLVGPLGWSRLFAAAIVASGMVLALGFGSLTALASGALLGAETFVLAAVLGVPLIAALAVRHYHRVVVLAFLLFGVVQLEPAPVDGLFALLLPIGLLTGALDYRRLAGSVGIHGLVWTLVIVTWVSVTQAAEPVTSIRYTLITLYCIAIMYFVKMYVISTERMTVIVVGYLLGAIVAVVGVLGDLIGLVPDEVLLEQGRARGLFKDSNVFGPFLVIALLILLDETWRPKLLGWLPRAARMSGATIVLLGIFLTYSRATWGNSILTLGIYGALNAGGLTRAQRLRVLAGASIVAAGLAIFAIAFDQVDFLSQRANVLQSYDSERFDAQRTGLELGLSNLFGIGPAMTDTGGLFAPHSLYIRSFAETGLVGLMLLVGLLLALLVPALPFRKAGSEVYGIAGSVVFAAALGQLLNGLLIDTLHWRHFWLVLGLLWLTHNSPAALAASPSKPSADRAAPAQLSARSEGEFVP